MSYVHYERKNKDKYKQNLIKSNHSENIHWASSVPKTVVYKAQINFIFSPEKIWQRKSMMHYLLMTFTCKQGKSVWSVFYNCLVICNKYRAEILNAKINGPKRSLKDKCHTSDGALASEKWGAYSDSGVDSWIYWYWIHNKCKSL